MIVVLVYRPEAVEAPDICEPFDGVEIFGIYYDAESKGVNDMIDAQKPEHPDWQWLLVPNEKIKVGFDAATRR